MWCLHHPGQFNFLCPSHFIIFFFSFLHLSLTFQIIRQNIALLWSSFSFYQVTTITGSSQRPSLAILNLPFPPHHSDAGIIPADSFSCWYNSCLFFLLLVSLLVHLAVGITPVRSFPCCYNPYWFILLLAQFLFGSSCCWYNLCSFIPLLV